MNDVHYYRDLLMHRGRVEAVRRAVNAIIRQGDRVLEVGAGLGTFSLFAAEAGATRVWAVDGDPIILVGKAIAAANGYADRVEFVRGWVPDVELPEKADVVLFEDFPSRLLDAGTFHMLRAIHLRYTAEAVRTIPARARAFMAPITDAATYEDIASFPADEGEHLFGIDWSVTRSYALNTPRALRLDREALAADPVAVGDLWLNRLPDCSALDGDASWQMTEDGTVHGLAFWFDLELSHGEWVSNAPGAPEATWMQVFLPLDEPLAAMSGQSLHASVRRERDADGAPGWISWTLDCGGRTARGHEFASRPAALQDLFPLNAEAIPVLDPEAAREADILRLTDGQRSVAEIVRGLREIYRHLGHDQALKIVTRTLRGRTTGGEI